MIRAGFACVYDGRCPAMLMGDHGRRLWQASLAFNDRRRADGVRCEASENKFSAVGIDLCGVPAVFAEQHINECASGNPCAERHRGRSLQTN